MTKKNYFSPLSGITKISIICLAAHLKRFRACMLMRGRVTLALGETEWSNQKTFIGDCVVFFGINLRLTPEPERCPPSQTGPPLFEDSLSADSTTDIRNQVILKPLKNDSSKKIL